MPRPIVRTSGTSILELLVAVFIAGILIAATVPDLGKAQRRYAAHAAARQFRVDLARSRMDAILLGRTVTVVIDTLAGTWTATDAEGALLYERSAPPSVAVRTTANRQSIPFTARGTADLYSTTWIGPADDPGGTWHGIRVAPSGALARQ